MSDRYERPVRTGLVAAALLLAVQFNASRVSAQEAILLETIGAVRMARPDEIPRTDTEKQAFGPQAGQEHSESAETNRLTIETIRSGE